MTSGLEIVPSESISPSEQLDVLERSFDRKLGEDWFRWKHEEGPWGPSRGWAAIVDGRPAGLRLFTPWEWAYGGRLISGARALDGGVVPEARRRGVFAALVEREMDRLRVAGADYLLMSTAVPASRAAYEKLGWHVVDVVQHGYRPTWPFRMSPSHKANAVPLEEIARSQVPLRSTEASNRLSTRWTGPALAWRSDARAGHQYQATRLAGESAEHGLVFRIDQQGPARIIVVVLAWGEPRLSRSLVRATAAHYRAIAALEPIGAAADSYLRGPAARRGSSTVVVHTHGSSLEPLLCAKTWNLTLGDLEGAL